ncbi:hypothetical protein SAMN05421676_101206 [Salinibacillus kushneri]|uniref:Uncharacterized protein n=1 Tax=Salinibacillus kushneri TaxID=237682 RepID=A0A1H9YKS2_9BACI|nr:hypothetical protein [Salinibacillus kushneri]SES69693.1 hypothetical protein SAMN05421676_101206 [Salinibacillus kushneri]
MESDINKSEETLSQLDSEISSAEDKLQELQGGVEKAEGEPKELGAGQFFVGTDLPEGRYEVLPVGDGSNFTV